MQDRTWYLMYEIPPQTPWGRNCLLVNPLSSRALHERVKTTAWLWQSLQRQSYVKLVKSVCTHNNTWTRRAGWRFLLYVNSWQFLLPCLPLFPNIMVMRTGSERQREEGLIFRVHVWNSVLKIKQINIFFSDSFFA